MEESISGFMERGSWSDIVEHGERITRALRDVGVLEEGRRRDDENGGDDVGEDADAGDEDAPGGDGDGADGQDVAGAGEGGARPELSPASDEAANDADTLDPEDEGGPRPENATPPSVEWVEEEAPDYRQAFEEWNEWRPKAHERLDEDVNEKTADQASVDEGAGERAGKEPEEDLQSAGEKLADSYEKVEEGDSHGALDRWGDSIDYVARAADSAGRKAIRAVEDTVYRKVMTQLAPYYFDNDLVSANIQKTDSAGEGQSFVFEVNINDDDLKEAVSERLGEYDESVRRWHVDTEKETETVADVEGVEPPAERDDHRSTSN